MSETTARVGGGGEEAVVGTFLAEAQRRSVWPRAPAQRGRKRALEVGAGCRPRLLGGGDGGDRGSAPGARRLRSCTSPICSAPVGVGKGAGVGPAGL